MVRPSPLHQAWRLVKCVGDALQAPKEGWQVNVAYLCVRSVGILLPLHTIASPPCHLIFLTPLCLPPPSSPLNPRPFDKSMGATNGEAKAAAQPRKPFDNISTSFESSTWSNGTNGSNGAQRGFGPMGGMRGGMGGIVGQGGARGR